MGQKTSQNLVWPPFASHSATHLLDINQVVDCGLWNVGPLFNGCAKLLDIGGISEIGFSLWQEVQYTLKAVGIGCRVENKLILMQENLWCTPQDV